MSDHTITPTTDPSHPVEAITTPKGERVWVVLRQEGDYDEDRVRWIAGVYTRRDLAETALGDDSGWVLPIPLNCYGRFLP